MPKQKNEDDHYFQRLAEAADDATPTTWLDKDYSGQLAVDVFENPESFIVRSAIAGVTAEQIDITVNNDMVTIKGLRQVEEETEGAFLYQECYWGGFSRTIILPLPVKSDQVKATLKNGILRVVLPKAEEQRPGNVTVTNEEADE